MAFTVVAWITLSLVAMHFIIMQNFRVSFMAGFSAWLHMRKSTFYYHRSVFSDAISALVRFRARILNFPPTHPLLLLYI